MATRRVAALHTVQYHANLTATALGRSIPPHHSLTLPGRRRRASRRPRSRLRSCARTSAPPGCHTDRITRARGGDIEGGACLRGLCHWTELNLMLLRRTPPKLRLGCVCVGIPAASELLERPARLRVSRQVRPTATCRRPRRYCTIPEREAGCSLSAPAHSRLGCATRALAQATLDVHCGTQFP